MLKSSASCRRSHVFRVCISDDERAIFEATIQPWSVRNSINRNDLDGRTDGRSGAEWPEIRSQLGVSPAFLKRHARRAQPPRAPRATGGGRDGRTDGGLEGTLACHCTVWTFVWKRGPTSIYCVFSPFLGRRLNGFRVQWSAVTVTPSGIGKSVTVTDCHSNSSFL